MAKTTTKKSAKTAAKKTTATKVGASKKKAASKTVGTEKATSTKKATAKKATSSKKAAAKKATSSASSKKAASKKTAAKKTAAKKTAAKKTAAKKTTTSTKVVGKSASAPSGSGRQLVIVESPAKAKTINKYLGSDFIVHASVGHIRDLPKKAPKGVKQPVPGVDLDNDFKPTYAVLSGKAKNVAELKRLAKQASDVWFATDLDREGEAIAWHLAQELGIDPTSAKRVVFNAITKTEVQRAFSNPHPIDTAKVNAQQARRILDRIVGYQASPLLWKKVARGLSAGRVQSVAVRLVVEREREIRAFVPDETWKVSAQLALDVKKAPALTKAWRALLGELDDKGKGPTLKRRNAWLADNGSLMAELVEVGGERFNLGCKADAPRDLSKEITKVAEAVGLSKVQVTSVEDPEGRGPARFRRTLTGVVDTAARYAVKSIETRRTTSRPSAPFITSSLQIAAANRLGFSAQRTMRTAQALYEGVNVPGEGQVGLITYMRTDSTNIAPEAIDQARQHIAALGSQYLPAKPNVYSSTNKDAQEAHEAIRPTAVERDPASLAAALTPDQYKLYDLIWRRFVASQMVPAQWDATSVLFERRDRPTGAVLKATGRVLAFDGFYRVAGVPTASDEQTLPSLREGQPAAPFGIDAEQRFSSPPPRYTEASLVKTLESEGIGRPSTYASIIGVIQDRKYVEQLDRRFYATDLGEVVTDKLQEAFPELMDVGYTRAMEAQLDKIEEQSADWIAMLHEFYGPFAEALESAHDMLTHAKAETQPAIYKCPKCGSRTEYRFGRNGRFLSCSAYPECDYSAPIDRKGRPLLPELVDVTCPEDGSKMELRNGRFGPFLASVDYPKTTYVINLDKKMGIKYPVPPPLLTDIECPKCNQGPLNLRRGKRGPWLGCSRFPKCRGRMAWSSLDEDQRTVLEAELVAHERANPVPIITHLDGTVIPEGTPVASLVIPGGVAELELHEEAVAELAGTEGNGVPPWAQGNGAARV
ncbi:MAG: type I DNA topoisomerase [Myxococcales bacterium]|nr:type I DNA topoisomerase [Myxococcales bacterium]MCB9715315.1 type I DNA topoisomerase [Myxococcales bacterium]